jgi:hypothetical protein
VTELELARSLAVCHAITHACLLKLVSYANIYLNDRFSELRWPSSSVQVACARGLQLDRPSPREAVTTWRIPSPPMPIPCFLQF